VQGKETQTSHPGIASTCASARRKPAKVSKRSASVILAHGIPIASANAPKEELRAQHTSKSPKQERCMI